MKFAEHLSSHLTPEWRKQYIHYDKMKKMLYIIVEKAPPADETDSEVRRRYLVQKEEEFFKFCSDQLNKINLFFNQKLAEALTKSRDLTRDIDILQRISQAKARKHKSQAHAKDASVVQRLKRVSAVPKSNSHRVSRDLEQDEISTASMAGANDISASDRNLLEAKNILEDHKLPKTMRECKSAFAEFYLSLVLLQNYQQLNGTGFRKILKKHDKLLQTDRGQKWYNEWVVVAPFFTDKEVDNMIVATERIVTDKLEDGNRQAAMKRLRVPPLNEVQNVWTTFRLGFFLGSFLIMAFLIAVTAMLQKHPYEPRWVAVRLFRGFLLLFANVFLMGVNMYGWQSSGVNHVLIFEIDPRDHLTYQSLMEISAFFAAVWSLCVLGYLHSSDLNCPATIFPLILLGVCIMWLLNPTPYLLKSSRFWFIRHLNYCFTAPFRSVAFADFWLADQMNSLITLFLDMEYFVCFYINYVDYSNGMRIIITDSSGVYDDSALNEQFHLHANDTQSFIYNPNKGIDIQTGADICITNAYGIRPVISCLPSLIRLFQCLRRYMDSKKAHPHLTNAGKYATTLCIVLFGSLNTYVKTTFGDNGFFYAWVLAYIFSFIYALTWDIKMDWSLLETNHRGAPNRFLRDDIIYQKWTYYLAIVEDALLRLAWVLNVSAGDAWLSEIDLLMLITGPLEIIRRFVWNFFRLENEHVNNCGQFRATRDLHIAPLTRITDWGDVERKMDEDDGIVHRGEQFTQLHDIKLKTHSRQHFGLRRKIAKTLKPISQVSTAFGSLGGGGHGRLSATASRLSIASALFKTSSSAGVLLTSPIPAQQQHSSSLFSTHKFLPAAKKLKFKVALAITKEHPNLSSECETSFEQVATSAEACYDKAHQVSVAKNEPSIVSGPASSPAFMHNYDQNHLDSAVEPESNHRTPVFTLPR